MRVWCCRAKIRTEFAPDYPWVVQTAEWVFRGDRDTPPDTMWSIRTFTAFDLQCICDREKIFEFVDARPNKRMTQIRCTSMTLAEALRVAPIVADNAGKAVRLLNLATSQIVMLA